MMHRADSLLASDISTNRALSGSGLISMQLSFSTADVENQVFYGPKMEPVTPTAEGEGFKALVVHGEFHRLEEEAELPHGDVTPLGQDAGIFRIIGLDEQAPHAQ